MINSAYYSTCDDYGVDADETWMYGDWFYTIDYGIFGHEVMATKSSQPDNLTRWIITQSKVLQERVLKRQAECIHLFSECIHLFSPYFSGQG